MSMAIPAYAQQAKRSPEPNELPPNAKLNERCIWQSKMDNSGI